MEHINRALLLLWCCVLGLLPLGSHAAGLKTEYEYDAVGNIRRLSTQNGQTTYNYDALDRLTGETGPALSTTYTYDANGNRLTGGGATLTYPVPPGETASNRVKTRQTAAGTSTYIYDSSTFGSTGNVVDDGTYQYVYTPRGLLKQVKQGATIVATYSYDYLNRRTRKVAGATTTVYHYDYNGNLIAETSSTNTAQRTYAVRDTIPVGQVNHLSGASVTFLQSDNLGTPRVGRDASKNITWNWYSDAFGNTVANSSPTVVNLRFPGQYFDAETALHYNWHRFYDPKLGRYLQSDPIGLPGGVNSFEYAGDNPLSFSDPDGLRFRNFGRRLSGPGSVRGPVLRNELRDRAREMEDRRVQAQIWNESKSKGGRPGPRELERMEFVTKVLGELPVPGEPDDGNPYRGPLPDPFVVPPAGDSSSILGGRDDIHRIFCASNPFAPQCERFLCKP